MAVCPSLRTNTLVLVSKTFGEHGLTVANTSAAPIWGGVFVFVDVSNAGRSDRDCKYRIFGKLVLRCFVFGEQEDANTKSQ